MIRMVFSQAVGMGEGISDDAGLELTALRLNLAAAVCSTHWPHQAHRGQHPNIGAFNHIPPCLPSSIRLPSVGKESITGEQVENVEIVLTTRVAPPTPVGTRSTASVSQVKGSG
jgi:hypothetical protein